MSRAGAAREPDYKYEALNLSNFFDDSGNNWFVDGVRLEALEKTALAFATNVDRVYWLSRMPPLMAYYGYVTGIKLTEASYDLAGRFLSESDIATPTEEYVTEEVRNAAADRTSIALYPGHRVMDSPEAWRTGCRLMLASKENIGWVLDGAIKAALHTAITGTWSAFEYLARELWMASTKVLLKQLQAKNPEDARAAELDKIRGEKEKLRWGGVELIKSHYRKLFPHPEDPVNRILGEGMLVWLSEVRHAIIHDAGFVGAKFKRKLDERVDRDGKPLPEPPPRIAGLWLGNPIPIDGELTTDLVNPVVESGIELFKAMEEWVLCGGVEE